MDRHPGTEWREQREAPSSEVLDRYLAGEATLAERGMVEAWRRTAPPAESIVTELVSTLSGGDEEAIPLAATAITERANQILALPAPKSWHGQRRQSIGGAMRQQRPRPWMYGAGAATIVALVTFWYSTTNRHPVTVPGRAYTTQAGQQAIVRLADGSQVQLAPQTTLTVPAGFSANNRTVDIVGEARFDVQSVTQAPFRVRTGSVTTQVLGTQFEVRRYRGDAEGRVVVHSGKVGIRIRGASTTLSAGMVGAFTDSVVTPLPNGDRDLADTWTEDQLVFRRVQVSALLTTLRRWYGYEFRLADSSLAGEYVTATFPIGQTTEMMQRLKRLLHVSMTIKDSVVTLDVNRARDGGPQARREKNHIPFPVKMEAGR
jgi:transmembrane sensor